MMAAGPIAAGRYPEIAARIGRVFKLDLSGLIIVFRGGRGTFGYALAIRDVEPVLWLLQEYRGPHPDGDGSSLVHWQPSIMWVGRPPRRARRELERRARLTGWPIEDLAPAMDELMLSLACEMPAMGTA